MLSLTRRLGRCALAEAAGGTHLQAAAASTGLLSALQQLRHGGGSLEGARQLTTSAARQAGGPRPAAPAAFADLEDIDDEGVELRLPDDLNAIAAINPRLRDVILQHRSQQKSASAVETMLETLDAAGVPRLNARITKSSLSRLRVDALRQLAEQLGADSRGTKLAVVDRLLQLASHEQEGERQAEAAVAAAAQLQADEPQEGVVSRRQLAAQATVARRLADAAQRGGYGLPEASLREAHRDMVQPEGQPFSHIFSPDEVANILADARAEDVAIIDVRGACPFTDHMVVATARSARLAHMLAGAVLHALKARAKEVAPGVAPVIEGAVDDCSEWLVVDAGSVVAHIFLEGYRQEYALEELWGRPGGANIRRLAPRKTVHTLDSIQ